MKIIESVKNIFYLLKETTSQAIEDNLLKLAAALSFFTIFSLPPLLVILISLSGFFFGEEAVQGTLFGQINGMIGDDAASKIQEAIKNVKLSGNTTIATVISITILVLGASRVFAEIQSSINFIWGIRAKPKKGFMKFLLNRLMSFSMIASLGFLLMVSLFINTAVDVLSNTLMQNFNDNWVYLTIVLNYVLLFVIVTTLFTIIFKTLPDGKVKLRDSIIGGLFTAFLFLLGKFGLGLVMGYTDIGSIYGAAGSIVLILVWVFFTAIILFFGAEFTKVYAAKYGKKIEPNEYTVKVVTKVVED
ncbi:MAG: YihY/virulence factor BrkB family protein [Brumimicrobium sp.]